MKVKKQNHYSSRSIQFILRVFNVLKFSLTNLSSGGIFGNVPLKMRLMITNNEKFNFISNYYLSNHFLQKNAVDSTLFYFHFIHTGLC